MMEKEKLVLIIYDISDTKDRNKMVQCLEQYGIRVQKSAFEAILREKQLTNLIKESSNIINKKTDSLRIYILNDLVAIKSWGIAPEQIDDCIII